MASSDPNRSPASDGSSSDDDEEEYRTEVVKRTGSAFWGNARFRWRVLPMSPIPESPKVVDDASDAESTAPEDVKAAVDEVHAKLQQSLQNLSLIGKESRQQQAANEEHNVSDTSPTYSPDENAANPISSQLVDGSSPGSSSSGSSDADNSLNITYNRTTSRNSRRSLRISNASTLVLSPDTQSNSAAPDSPVSPNSPDSLRGMIQCDLYSTFSTTLFSGKIKRQGVRRRRIKTTTRHYTRGVERIHFHRYIYALFRGSFSSAAVQQSRRPKKSATSETPESSSATGIPRPIAKEASTSANQPQRQPKRSSRLASDPNREITKISTKSMAVLNSIVKDLIQRIAVESNRLLAGSRYSTLRSVEALAAIRMILRHREDLCHKVLQQHEQLTANMPGRGNKRVKRSVQPQAASSPQSDQSTPRGPPPPPSPPPGPAQSRYGPGSSPQPGPSGISRH